MSASRPPPEPDPRRDRGVDAADPGRERDVDRRTGDRAARIRAREQHRWVDLQIERAMERGDFDDLPGAGKPIEGLGGDPDPDWWVKRLIERERITGVAPPAIGLRTEDAGLDDRLDRLNTPDQVRAEVEDFNRRVVEARRQLQGGPPVVTPTRDVEGEVERWRERRRPVARTPQPSEPAPPRRRWWPRRR